MTPLILLPGALGTRQQFQKLQAELDGLGIPSSAYDLPGHGLQPFASASNTVPLMAGDLIQQIDAAESSGPLNIFGHSLGGYIGLYLCLTQPEKVNRLFTLGTKWNWDPAIASRETSFLVPEIMEKKIPDYVLNLKQNHSQDWRIIVSTITYLMNDLGENQYLLSRNLETISQVIRIGLGDRDAMVTMDETIATYKALPNAEMQVLPRTPHPYERTNVKQLAMALRDFFYPEG